MKNISRNVFLVLLVLSSFGVFFANSSVPMQEPEGAHITEIARDMLQRGNFASRFLESPELLGISPLCYWLTAVSFQVFGLGDFAARFPVALLAIMTVLMVYIFATKIWNERTGFWAGMVLSSCMLFLYTGKVSMTGAASMFLFSGILLCFMREFYHLMYLFAGTAVMTQGPIGLFLPFAVILVYLLLTSQAGRWKKLQIFPGVLISCVVFAPWYLLLFEAHGIRFLLEALRNSLAFIPNGAECMADTWYVYIILLLAGLFPWTGLWLKSVKDSICESRTTDLMRNLFLQVWWIIPSMFVLFFGCGRAESLNIMLPAFSMLASWNMERMIREDRDHFIGWTVGSLLTCLIAAVTLFCIGLNVPALVFGTIILGTLVLLLGLSISISLLYYKDGMLAAWLHVATGFLVLIILYYFLLPVVLEQGLKVHMLF